MAGMRQTRHADEHTTLYPPPPLPLLFINMLFVASLKRRLLINNMYDIRIISRGGGRGKHEQRDYAQTAMSRVFLQKNPLWHGA